MTGELFEIEEKNMKVVSLDGHRIAMCNIRLGENYAAKKVVIPGNRWWRLERLSAATQKA